MHEVVFLAPKRCLGREPIEIALDAFKPFEPADVRDTFENAWPYHSSTNLFGSKHLDELASISDEISQRSALLIVEWSYFRTNCVTEMSKQGSIDRVGLGDFDDRFDRIPYLARA